MKKKNRGKSRTPSGKAAKPPSLAGPVRQSEGLAAGTASLKASEPRALPKCEALEVLTKTPSGITISSANNSTSHLRWVPLVARTDPYLLIILIIPVLVLIRDTNIVFSAPGYIDPWVYLGFFHNLIAYKHDLFPLTYYGSRLSWILPAYVINKLFTPLLSNYVLHLGVFYIATMSLFYTLKWTIDRKAALLAVLALGFHSSFWKAVGWDYVDGVGIAYYLLTTALLTYAAGRERERFGLFLAGMCYGALIYSNATWLMYSPFFPVYYIVRRQIGRKASYIIVFSRFVLWFGAGLLSLTAALCAINYKIDGYIWFYAPSLSYGGSAILRTSPWRAPDLSWVLDPKVSWLLLPSLTLLISMAAIFRERGRLFSKANADSVVFLGNFVYLTALMIWLEVRVSPFLQFFYYASYLIPPAFLVLGSRTFRVSERLNPKQFLVLALLAVLILAIPWWDAQGSLPRMLGLTRIAVVFSMGAGMLATLFFPGRPWAVMLFCACLSTFNLYYGNPNPIPANTGKDTYLRIVQGLRSIEGLRRPSSVVRFWFDVRDPYGKEFDSLNSTYLWGYSYIGREFPSLRPDLNVPAGTMIVMPSSNNHIFPEAQRAFMRKGLSLRPIAQRWIHSGSGGYSLVFLEVVPTPGNVRPLALSRDRNAGLVWVNPEGTDSDLVLPANMWTIGDQPDSSVTLARLPGGPRVTANSAGSKHAVIYGPLRVSSAGRYLFSLKVRLETGSLNFGVLNGDKTKWLVEASLASIDGRDQYQDCSLALAAGEQFWLAAGNASVAATPSAFMIEELKAYQYKD